MVYYIILKEKWDGSSRIFGVGVGVGVCAFFVVTSLHIYVQWF